jgi:HEAT repeat protein
MRIFISYGRGDALEFARELATRLKAEGFTPWLDIDEGIPLGSPFDVRIELGIEGCDLLIALLSPWSLRPEGFCRNELLFAQAKNRPIIPVRIANVIPPIQIISLNYLDACAGPDALFRELPGLIRQVAQSGRMILRDWPVTDAARSWWVDAKHLSFQEELARHGGSFIGREWLFRQLQDWIAEPDSRFLLMTADAGVGKSAIAAQMTARLNVRGVHFCSRSQAESCRFRSWLAALIQQLASQFPSYARSLTALGPPAWEDPPVSLFRTLVTQPLNECSAELDITEPWVFVVDALDESLAEAGPDLANLLAESVERLPPWFRIIATSRPDRSLMACFALNSVRHRHLNAECEPNREDLENYLHERLGRLAAAGAATADVPVLTSRIATLADGNFLFAKMTLDALADPDDSSRLKPENLGELPSKLGGLYSAMFRRRFTNAERYEAQVLPLLDCLVAARSPLPEGTLTSASGLDRRAAQQALRQLSQFLSAGAEGLRLFHQSVANWLTDDRASAEFAALPASGHERLAEAGWREFRAGVAGMSSYMTLHLPQHLAQAGRAEDLATLLSTPDWLKRKLALSDPLAVVGDYDHLPRESALRAIQGAVRISAYTLALHPEQLAAQLLGRLGDRTEPELAAFLRALRDSQGPGWSLLPRTANLRGPDSGTVSSWRIDEAPEACHLAFSPDGFALAFITRATIKYRRVDTGAVISPESFEHTWQEAESANWRESVPQTPPPALPDNQRDWSFRKKWTCTTPPGSASARIVVDWVRIEKASNRNSGDRYKDLVAQEVFFQKDGRWHRIEGTGLAVPATAVAVSRNGDFLAIATIDGTLSVWCLLPPISEHQGRGHPETGEFWRVGEPLLRGRQGSGAIQAIAINASGDRVATLNTSGLVTFWATASASHSIDRPLASGPEALFVLPRADRAFVVDQDRGLAVWDTHSGERLAYLGQDMSMGYRIKLMISPDFRFAVSIEATHDMYDGFLIQVLDVEEGCQTLDFETDHKSSEIYASLPRECRSVEGRLYALPAPETGCVDLATGTFVDPKVANGPTAKAVPWLEVESADDPWCSIMERGGSASVRVPLAPAPLAFTVDDEISQLAMAPDGSCVVVGCRSGAMHFLELLWNLGSDDATRRQVEEALGSSSLRLRCVAARALSGVSGAWASTLLQKVAAADLEPLVRRSAILAMGTAGVPPAVLRPYVRDPALIVRQAVVDVLALSGDAEGLIMALGDADQNQRRRAADALGQLGSASAADALDSLLKDPNPGIVMAARRGIVHQGGPRAIALLEHPDIDRTWALAELSAIATPPAIYAMVRLLEGGCSDAAKALEKLGWQPAEPELRAKYAGARHQWDEAVRTGAAAVPELVKQLQICRGEWEAKAPADALRRIGDSSAIAPLLRLLREVPCAGDGGAVGQGKSVFLPVADIAETLVAIGGHSVQEPLLAAYEAGDSSTKCALLHPLAMLGGQEAGTIINADLSEAGDLAGPAARAAAVYPERELVMAALLAAAERGEPDAVDALASLQGQRAIPALLKALESGSGRGRQSAATALVKIAGEAALPAFERALDSELRRNERDRDQQFLAAIASGLSALGIPAAVPPMLMLLKCCRDTYTYGHGPACIAAKGLMSLVPADKLIPLLVSSLRRTSYGCLDPVDVLRLVPKALDALPEGTAIDDVEQVAEKLAQAMSVGLWDFLQEEVAAILGRMGEPAIPAIARRLENADWQIRRHFIHALAAMQSTRALPLLASAINDEYAHVRIEAVAGLRRLGTPEALAALKVECHSGAKPATYGPQPAQ